jgi:hypothetical protein
LFGLLLQVFEVRHGRNGIRLPYVGVALTASTDAPNAATTDCPRRHGLSTATG